MIRSNITAAMMIIMVLVVVVAAVMMMMAVLMQTCITNHASPDYYFNAIGADGRKVCID